MVICQYARDALANKFGLDLIDIRADEEIVGIK